MLIRSNLRRLDDLGEKGNVDRKMSLQILRLDCDFILYWSWDGGTRRVWLWWIIESAISVERVAVHRWLLFCVEVLSTRFNMATVVRNVQVW